MKACCGCKAWKGFNDFTKDKGRRDGLNPYCRECTRARNRATAAKNPEAARARGKAWVEANPERQRARTKAWRDANPGKNAEYSERWRKANPGAQSVANAKFYAANRERLLADDKARRQANLEAFLERERISYERNKEARQKRLKAWNEKNKHKINAYAAHRRSAVGQRTPPWLTEAQTAQIEVWFWYALLLSESTGVPHHVDHIVPLRGKLVSGLNVPWNLQAIPAIENLKKNNSHAVA